MPNIAVVIPCRNGAATLGAQLDAICSQVTRATFEVVVANNGSTDGTAALVTGYGDLRVRLVDASARAGINHARNAGVRAVSPDVRLVLFCDSDDLVHPGWIEAYWSAFLSGVRLAGGTLIRVSPDGTRTVQDHLNKDLGFLPWPAGANWAVDRSLFEELGPFDETYIGGGDETGWCWRAQLAGVNLYFISDAVVDYTARPDRKTSYRQKRQFGYSHVKLYKAFHRHGMPPRHGLGMLKAFILTPLNSLRQKGVDPLVNTAALAQGLPAGSLAFRAIYL